MGIYLPSDIQSDGRSVVTFQSQDGMPLDSTNKGFKLEIIMDGKLQKSFSRHFSNLYEQVEPPQLTSQPSYGDVSFALLPSMRP